MAGYEEKIREILRKKELLKEKLTPGNVTVETVRAAMGEILPEGKEIEEKAAEEIFSGVGKGLMHAADAEGKDVEQMIKESVAKRLGSYDEEERNEEIGKLREELDMPESTEEELVEKACDVIVKNVKKTAERAKEAMIDMYCTPDEEKEAEKWSRAERGVIDAAAVYLQAAEDGEEVENAELIGCNAGIHEYAAKKFEEACNSGSDWGDALAGVLIFAAGAVVTVALTMAWNYVADLILAIPAIEALGTVGLLIGAFWPLIAAGAICAVAFLVDFLIGKIRERHRMQTVDRIGRGVSDKETQAFVRA